MEHFSPGPSPAAPAAAYAAIAVRGAGARAFLQGQLTQDLERLGPTALLRAALNTPQGRVVALPWVVERGAETLLLLPAELAAPVCTRLKRYVLRAKVELEVLSPERLAFATLGPRASGAAAPVHELRGPALSVLWFSNRTLLAAPAAELARASAAAGLARLSSEAWRLALIESGEPDVVGASSEHWVAQMLNLDLTDGVSFSKGCYTGQEIVARTQNLGRIKRRTLRYRATGAVMLPAVLEPLRLGAAKVGEVVLSTLAAGGVELLAVVALEARDQPLATPSGLVLEPLPLPYPVP